MPPKPAILDILTIRPPLPSVSINFPPYLNMKDISVRSKVEYYNRGWNWTNLLESVPSSMLINTNNTMIRFKWNITQLSFVINYSSIIDNDIQPAKFVIHLGYATFLMLVRYFYRLSLLTCLKKDSTCSGTVTSHLMKVQSFSAAIKEPASSATKYNLQRASLTWWFSLFRLSGPLRMNILLSYWLDK